MVIRMNPADTEIYFFQRRNFFEETVDAHRPHVAELVLGEDENL